MPVDSEPIVDEKVAAEKRTMETVEGESKQQRRLRDLCRKFEKRDAGEEPSKGEQSEQQRIGGGPMDAVTLESTMEAL